MSFKRQLKRHDLVLRKGRTKKNTRGKPVGPARTPSIYEAKTKWVHIERSLIPKEVELGEPLSSCKHCYGTGIAGRLKDTKEDLICRCVAKQIEPAKGKEDEDTTDKDKHCDVEDTVAPAEPEIVEMGQDGEYLG